MPVALEAGSYSVMVDPEGGGAILAADWRSPAGKTLAVLEPTSASLAPFKAGCFPMVPFANRIADARFRLAGRDHAVPLNRPAEAMAIHGFGRENPWRVVERNDATLVLEQDFAHAHNPYRYNASQKIELSDDGLQITLGVRNDGPDTLPFGIGLHPWFPKTPLTTLGFRSRGMLARDARGLPVAPPRAEPAFEPDAPAALGDFRWLDGFFEGWAPRDARIARPEDGVAIDISADGAFRHLHVYVPDDRPVLCAEPVSHAPDAINRPELGVATAMQALAPGETLAGTMTLRATSCSPA